MYIKGDKSMTISKREQRRIGVAFAMQNNLDFRKVYNLIRMLDIDNEELLIHELEKQKSILS